MMIGYIDRVMNAWRELGSNAWEWLGWKDLLLKAG